MLIVLDQNQDYGDHTITIGGTTGAMRSIVPLSLTTTDALIVVM